MRHCTLQRFILIHVKLTLTSVKQTSCSLLQLDRDLIAGAFADVFRKMICQQVEVLVASMESGKTIQELVKEYDDREKLDERLKQMTAKELLLRDKAYFEMKWCGERPFSERFLCWAHTG